MQDKFKLHKSYEVQLKKEPNPEWDEVSVLNSEEVREWAVGLIGDQMDIQMYGYCLFVDFKNTVLGYAKIAQGGTTSAQIDSKIILKMSIDLLAEGVILIVNRPSGNLKPSSQDKRLAGKLSEACRLINSKLLDLLVITKESYYSFADEAIL